MEDSPQEAGGAIVTRANPAEQINATSNVVSIEPVASKDSLTLAKTVKQKGTNGDICLTVSTANGTDHLASTSETVNEMSPQRDICLTVTKLSKQQKVILVALQCVPDQTKEFRQLHRLVLITTGVDTYKLWRQNQEFHRHRGPGGPQPWMAERYQVKDRPVYDSNRKAVNKAYATVSRSLARLYERGLLDCKVTARGQRYPVLTNEGNQALTRLKASEIRQITARVSELDQEINAKKAEDERSSAEAIAKLRGFMHGLRNVALPV